MELMAAIEGLRPTQHGADVILRSDSRYVVDSMTRHYKRNKNHDLWELLDAETKSRRVRFEWVRGHDTDATNNRADELALMGANGRLLAAGASPKKKRIVVRPKSDDSAAEAELTPRLKPEESIRECAGCGAKFVSVGAAYCSQVSCQVQARSRVTR
jgi:ribonuclease HI